MKESSFSSKLVNAVQRRGFAMFILGQIGNGGKAEFIYLVSTLRYTPSLPHLLIAGGFHGDEIAGPLAILKFLTEAPDSYFTKANLLFLPCVNPIGFRNNTHYAIEGIKTNVGFCHPENGDRFSFEGKILIKHDDLILISSSDGFLSLHEDTEVDKFYVYTFGMDKQPGKFERAMRDEGLRYFSVIPDGTNISLKDDPEVKTIDGFVHNLHDGSLEDFLYHEGALHSMTTETPAKDIPLENRVQCNVALIRKFVELSVEESKQQ